MYDSKIKNKKDHNFDIKLVELSDLFLLFAQNIKILISIPLLFVVIVYLDASFFSPKLFQASGKIMSYSKSGDSGLAGFASQFGMELPISQSESKWAYSSILKSRTLAKEILANTFFTKKNPKGKKLIYILKDEFKIENEDDFSLETIVTDIFLKMVRVTKNNSDGIYTISVSSFEPKLSVSLVNALIEGLDKHQRNYARKSSMKTRQFIEERIIETQKELEIKEEDLKVFTTRNKRIENSPLLLLEEQRLLREVSVLTSVFTTLKQSYETSKIEELKDIDYVILIDQPELPLSYISPNKKFRIISAFLGGLFLSIVISLILGYVKNLNDKNKNKYRESINLIKSSFNRPLI